VPLLEARLVQTRAGYRDYMATTHAFIPWPPRHAHADDASHRPSRSPRS